MDDLSDKALEEYIHDAAAPLNGQLTRSDQPTKYSP
jgi:hypothetical protein